MRSKEIHNMGKDEKLKYIFRFLSSVNRDAYKDIYLLSNDVLSKNPFGSDFINKVLRNNNVENINTLTIGKKLFLYYIKSFIIFTKYILEFFIFILEGKRFSLQKTNDYLIIIDTFLLVNDVINKKRFKDLFFLDFDLLLKSRGKNYVYLPVLINNKSLLQFQKLLNILANQSSRVLLEYQLLRLKDYIELFIFIIKYPVHVLSFCSKMKSNTIINQHLKNELKMSLDRVTFQNFSRYLLGRRVAGLSVQNLKVISWYENQVIDKNFYRGINDINSKIEIIGAKPYIFSDEVLNEIPDEVENSFCTLPDKIVLSGNSQIPKKTSLNYVIGPSFRYKKLFQDKIDFTERSQVLVLLTIYDHEIKNILQIINSMDFPKNKIMVKFHPDIKIEKYAHLIHSEINIVDDDLYDLFKKTKIVVGISTGALIESACMAIPSIIIPHPEKFSLKFFPELGRGTIWDEVNQQNNLDILLNKFDKIVKYKKDELLDLSEKYRSLYVTEPTEENIIKAYEL